jgi:ParB family chromosome partitioning protein
MARKKAGLGRGLGALIPTNENDTDEELPPAARMGVREVPVGSLLPNPKQPRTMFDQEALADLAASIREHGVIQPLIVTQIEDGAIGERFQIIAGERRWRASKLAGLETVPVIVKETTPQEMLVLALIENVQRADLSPLEEAEAYHQMSTEFALKHEEIAHWVGKSRPVISNTMRLLALPDTIRDMMLRGELSAGHARAIAVLEKASEMMDVAERVLDKGLTVRQTESLVRAVQAGASLLPTPPPRPPQQPPDTARLEARFRDALSAKVKLKRGVRGGQLIIYFRNDEDLQHLYEVIAHEDD